jgi:hypothetical protein
MKVRDLEAPLHEAAEMNMGASAGIRICYRRIKRHPVGIIFAKEAKVVDKRVRVHPEALAFSARKCGMEDILDLRMGDVSHGVLALIRGEKQYRPRHQAERLRNCIPSRSFALRTSDRPA